MIATDTKCERFDCGHRFDDHDGKCRSKGCDCLAFLDPDDSPWTIGRVCALETTNQIQAARVAELEAALRTLIAAAQRAVDSPCSYDPCQGCDATPRGECSMTALSQAIADAGPDQKP